MGNSQSHGIPIRLLTAEITALRLGNHRRVETVPAKCHGMSDIEIQAWYSKRCKKYSNREDHERFFTSVRNLSLDHLPEQARHQCLVDAIKKCGRSTVKLTVSFVSESRPDTLLVGKIPGSTLDCWGSGFVVCSLSLDTSMPGCKPGRSFLILTAAHVVYDQSEVERTTVEFFHEDDADVSGVIRAKGVKLTYTNVDNDVCLFMCEVASEAEGDRVKRGIEFEIDDAALDGIKTDVAFMVSHPHGSAAKVSVGRVTAVEDWSIDDIDKLLQVIVDKCLARGLKEKTVLCNIVKHVIYQEKILSNLHFLLKQCVEIEVLVYLESIGLIQIPNSSEENIITHEINEINANVKKDVEEKFVSKHGAQTMSPRERDEKTKEIREEILSGMCSSVTLPDGFLQRFWDVHARMWIKISNILAGAPDHYHSKTSLIKSAKYSVPTCPGSSGALVFAFHVSDNKVRFTSGVHHGTENDGGNISGVGFTQILNIMT